VTLTAIQDAELTLIQEDVNDLINAVMSQKQHPERGVLAYAIVPLIGLVTDESLRYLANAPEGLALLARQVNESMVLRRAVTKARARIKLYDDNDGYAAGLVEALRIAHLKSTEWFSVRHRGWRRAWIRHLQPDLGVYFVDDAVFATTHTILPAAGFTLEELNGLTPQVMKTLGERLFKLTFDVGAYFRGLAEVLAPLGKHIDLAPAPTPPADLRLGHCDFIGAKLYRAAARKLHLQDEGVVGSVIMAIAQVNVAVRVLPAVLRPGSNLLVRVQALTAYHARNVLEACIPNVLQAVPSASAQHERVLRCRTLRNVCAHYGLRSVSASAVGVGDPFGAAIEKLTDMRRAQVERIVGDWLLAVSNVTAEHISRPQLAPFRALLGSCS
jgi:hypothetical protein